MADHRISEAETRLVQLAQAFSFSADLIKQAGKLLFVQVAELQTKKDFARNHVVGARLNPDPAHGANLAAGHAGDNLVDLLNEASGGAQGVTALVHGRGA